MSGGIVLVKEGRIFLGKFFLGGCLPPGACGATPRGYFRKEESGRA